MKPLLCKLVGALFITLAVFSILFRVLGGGEFSLLPWPLALISLAVGVLVLRMGRELGKRSGSDEDPDWRGERFVLDTPLRIVVVLAALATGFVGVIAALRWGFESRHWSPPIVAMISLTVANLSLALCSLVLARKGRRNRRTHA